MLMFCPDTDTGLAPGWRQLTGVEAAPTTGAGAGAGAGEGAVLAGGERGFIGERSRGGTIWLSETFCTGEEK